MILLDTNVVSELMKPIADARVREWLNRQVPPDVFVCAPVQAEILVGLATMPDGKKRIALAAAATLMFEKLFFEQILSFDTLAAVEYAAICAARRRMGRPAAVFDCQIAAIARSRRATVATRNVSDFEDCAVDIVNPWTVV